MTAFNHKSSLLFIFLITISQWALSQTDMSMGEASASIGCNGVSNYDWGHGAGTISYINNGNFNFMNLGSNCNCTDLAYCTPVFYTNNDGEPFVIWSGGSQWAGPVSFAMNYSPQTRWQTNTKYYCDIMEAFPVYAYNNGFFKGFIETPFISQYADTAVYRYMLFEMNTPLTPGLEFEFEISMINRYNSTDLNSFSVDQIGFAFVNELPDYQLSHGSFLGDLITPDYVTPAGDFMINNNERITMNITGNGQKYLLIGIFNSPETSNYLGTMDNNAVCKYIMDTAWLIRTACPQPHVHFYTEEYQHCVGAPAAITAPGGFAPYTWTINGEVQETTTNVLNYTQAAFDQVITVSVDTGMCMNSDSIVSVPYEFFPLWTTDTLLACDQPLVMENTFYLDHITNADVTFTVEGLNTSYTQEVSFYSEEDLDISFTTTEPDDYHWIVSFDADESCTFSDTIYVLPPQPLTTGNDDEALVTYSVEAEHCINMDNGAITFHDATYPFELEYQWPAPYEDVDTSSIHTLSTGMYDIYLVDEAGRCNQYNIEVEQWYDACATIYGEVIFDRDKNCSVDSADTPFILQKVTAQPIGNFAYTDSSGHFTIYAPPGEYYLERTYPTPYFNTICSDAWIVALSQSGEEIGPVHFMDTLYNHRQDIEVTGMMVSNPPVIQNNSNIYLQIANMGDTLASGHVQVYVNGGYTTFLEGDYAIDEDSVTFSFSDINPTSIHYHQIQFSTLNDVDHIGDTLFITCIATLDNGSDAYTMLYSHVILGAYDPNIKEVFPEGFTEMKYTRLDTDRLKYVIHFQNTGNYPATDITIKDTLDALLDAGSLEITGSSHYVEVTNVNHEITFYFPHIMLADSSTNEPGSHGYVEFDVMKSTDAHHLDQIHNTVHIYFDANPAIVTNTTLSTLYDCSLLADLDYSIVSSTCDSSVVSANANPDWFVDESWQIGSLNFNDVSSIEFTIANQDNQLLHTVSNPLCGSVTQTVSLETPEVAIPAFAIDGSSMTLSNASDYAEFIWIINGVEQPDLTSVTIQPANQDEVQVSLTDINGCELVSEPIIFQLIQIIETNNSGISCWPNPADNLVTLSGIDTPGNIELIDISGKIIQTWACNGTGQQDLLLHEIAQGNYLLNITTENKSAVIQLSISREN